MDTLAYESQYRNNAPISVVNLDTSRCPAIGGGALFLRSEVKEIKLSQGKVALVDDEDFERVNQFKWYALLTKTGGWRAVRNIGRKPNKNRTLDYLPRFLVGAQPGQIVDHINGNGLDNRSSNLRFCTKSQNGANRKKQNSTSQFKGVRLFENKYWNAQIKVSGHKINLGLFKTELEAARIYDENAVKYFGKFARTNKMLGLLKEE